MNELYADRKPMNDNRPLILLIRFSSLGDVVLLSAAIDAIGTALPEFDLHLATKERYSELYSNSSFVKKIHTLPNNAGFTDLLRLRKALSSENYRIIIDAHNVIRSNVLLHTLSAPTKIQLKKDQMKKLSLIRGGRDLYSETIQMKDRFLGIVEELGVQVDRLPTRLDPGDEARASVNAFFESSSLADKPVIALAPGARWETKRWPERNYRDLAMELISRGYGVLLVGDNSEKEMCGRICDGTGAADVSGGISLLETAAALKRSAVLVTNDSAPLHIAEAVSTPVVAIFGPTVRQFGYFPLLDRSVALEVELDCRPCSRNGAAPCRLDRRLCLEQIEPARVLSALEGIVEQGE
jgi:heptosyltransferase-2